MYLALVVPWADQLEIFERLKIIYSYIVQKKGNTEQFQKAKEIIEKFENDIDYRKSMFTNHVNFFKFLQYDAVRLTM